MKRVTKLFSGEFQGAGCRFSSHCCFCLTDYYPSLVPVWPYPLWEAHQTFFQHLLTREQSGERAKVAVGPRGAPGRRHPFWGRTACGKVPADLQPFLGQWTLQTLLLRSVGLCPGLPPALPACCLPRGHSVLPVELPQCPVTPALLNFHLFFFLKSGKSLSKHYIDQNARLQFGCWTCCFALVILPLLGSQSKDRSAWFLEITCWLLFQLAKHSVCISTCLMHHLHSFKEHQHFFI